MAEIQTADGADGVKVLSPQEDPTTKSDVQDSENSETGNEPTEHVTKPKAKGRRSSITSNVQADNSIQAPGPVEVGHQGRVKTQWDNPDADPNKRKSIAEDPTGESNMFEGH